MEPPPSTHRRHRNPQQGSEKIAWRYHGLVGAILAEICTGAENPNGLPPAYYFTLKKDQEAELTEFLNRHGGTHIERLIFLSKMTLWASGRFNNHLWADRELDWDMAGQAFEVAAAAETQLHSDLKMARVGAWKGPKY